MGKAYSHGRKTRGWTSVRAPAACLGLLLAYGPAAKAHRVEGYLQATLISLTEDRVELEINITPGLEKYSEVLAFIDRNHDGQVSAQEWQVYAAGILKDVSLEFDHRRQSFAQAGSSFPLLGDMRAGVGTITLKLIADLPRNHPGRHHLYFRNRHQMNDSDYLLNCLQPPNGIEITRQVRDYRQTEIDIDFFARGASEPSGASLGQLPRWLLAPGLLLFLNIVRIWRFRGPIRIGRAGNVPV